VPVFANGKYKHVAAVAAHHLHNLEFLSPQNLLHLETHAKLQAAIAGIFDNK
jgi:hypothetical protein